MYKDMAEKMKFYKENIIQSFIELGVFPDDQMIKETLNDIDLSLPYLFIDEPSVGRSFDCEAYNIMFQSVYRDLALLYQLLEELAVKELGALNAFIDTHIDNLETTVNYYKDKATQETNSTSLGNTVLFKNNSFNSKINNNLTLIDLGQVDLHKGSRISCILNASDIEAEKVVFSFYDKENKALKTTAYNYNYGSLLIPGEINKKEYNYTISNDQKVSGQVKIDIGIEPNYDNDYTILAGKNKVLVKQFGESNNQYIKERPTKFNMLGFHERTYIDFYTVGTKSITFRFNKKPITTNFPVDSYQVSNLKYVHHFFIEADEGFSFDFDIDGGAVYAIREKGIIMDKELYLPKLVDTRDFHVIEYKLGDKETYSATIEIINDDGEPLEIQNVMIKELLSMEGDSNDTI